MDSLFPTFPDDLSKLSKDELETLRADSLAAIDKINAEDAEFLGDRTANQVIEEMTAGVEQIERVNDQLKVLAEAEESYQAEKAKLKARADAAAPEPEAEAVTDEPEAEADETEVTDEPGLDVAAETETDEPEAEAAVERELELVASAEKPTLRRPPKARGRHLPLKERSAGAAIVAAADIDGFSAGEELDGHSVARAMSRAAELNVSAPEGFRQNAIIASVKFPYPEERILDPLDSGGRNAEKIKAVTAPDALTAAGVCAPPANIYDIPVISVPDRPVRGALPAFQATRGGVNLPAPLTLGDISSGVGIITNDQAVAGGSPATKACQTVNCQAYTATYVAAVYHCMKFDNIGARTWPELVESFNEYLLAAHSRLAETALLDKIAAGSTAVTGAAVNGAVNTLVGHILEAAASIRSHHRMRDGQVLRAIFPAWVKDLLVLDIVRSQFERFAYQRDGIQQLFAMFDIAASFALDGETSSGQVFGAQSAGALLAFPTSLIWYLFPEGTWLYLDSGTLELGIVRDSSLNATNQFENFGEQWENVAKVGPVSYRVTSTVCPNGAVAAPGTAVTC